jgi:ABC-type transport system substrate-binding protein
MRVAGPPDPGGPFGWPPDIIGPAAASAQPVLEPLLRQLSDSSYIPWLASAYKVADDKMSITFTLRQGVKFHDGSDFNADAVKFNWDAQIEAKMEPYWKSVDVIDPYTVRLNLNSWTNMVLGTFGDGAPIASPTAFKKNGKEWADKNPVGTGPFVFEKYEQNTRITFKRFDNYWQKGKPYLDGIEILFIMDPLTLKAAMQSGELDMTNIGLGKQQKDFEDLGFITSVVPMTTYVLVPDTVNASSPFAKKEVREAVEYAIDRESIAKGLGFGYWLAPYQIPARSNAAFNKDFSLGRKYDPPKAKQLLTQAGYPNGFSTAIISQPAARQDDANAAIKAFLDAVGIKTELKNVDQATFANYQANGWSDAMLTSPIAAFGNFNSTLDFYFTDTLKQFSSWAKTPQFLADLKASQAAVTIDVSLIRKVTDTMITDATVIPTTESGLGFAYAKYVKDGGFNERGFPTNWNVDSVWLDK